MPKANGMFDVVTGTKRSGTSMMMYLLREAGVPIGGFKFPIRPETKIVQPIKFLTAVVISFQIAVSINRLN